MIRPRFQVRDAEERLLYSLTGILQITVTAVAAYAVCLFFLGHAQPLIAPIVAITALGFARDARPVRVLETVFAMTLGIVFAELLQLSLGSGVWQYAVALAGTLLLARLVSGSPAFALVAAVQSTLVMLMPPPAGGPFIRTLDGVVGGLFALIATAVIPRDPRREAVHAGRKLIAEHVAVLAGLAEAMRAGSAESTARSLERARATQPLVDGWEANLDSAQAIVRISPFLRRHRTELGRQKSMLASMDLAARNLRMVARRAAFLEEDGIPRPALSDLLNRIGSTLRLLSDSFADLGNTERARELFTGIAHDLNPDVLMPDPSMAERNIVYVLRPYLVDLITATGVEPAVARRDLPSL